MRRSGRYGRDHGPGGYDAGWRGDGRGGRRPEYDRGFRPYDAGFRAYDDAPFPRRGYGPGPGYSPYDATGWAPPELGQQLTEPPPPAPSAERSVAPPRPSQPPPPPPPAPSAGGPGDAQRP